MASLANTDERVRANKPVSPGFLFATLLWHEVLANWEKRKLAGELSIPALYEAMDEVLEIQGEKLAITRRIAGDVKEIWALQPRFDKRSGRAPFRLIEQARFRAAYDFLALRAESGEIPQDLADWWTEFPDAGPERREAMLVTGGGPKRRRRSRGKKASAGEATSAE
jgi:poly(A) polymerase